jgi:hypothetical protein
VSFSCFVFVYLLEVLVDKDYNIIHKDDRQRAQVKADELLEYCQEATNKKIPPSSSLEYQIDALAECMQTQVEEHLAEREEERSFQSQLRTSMAHKLIPYACGDTTFNENATFSVEHINRTWHFEDKQSIQKKQFQLQVFHERPTSQIFTIPNFAGDKECKSIQHFVNDNVRKVPFLAVNEQTPDAKVLHGLASKMYELARVFLAWQELDFDLMYSLGHELFNVYRDDTVTKVPKGECAASSSAEGTIGIETTNTNNNNEEEDKECKIPGAGPLEVETASVQVPSTQLATFFLFCDEPAEGLGGLHFPHAGVHINPEKGKLVVALHRYRNDKETDRFTQEWHLCPNHNVYTHGIFDVTPTFR